MKTLNEISATGRDIPLCILCDVIDQLSSLDISNCNGSYQRLVIRNIFNAGKSVSAMTVSELQIIINESSDIWQSRSDY